jgi:GT2 family glycosyltransferase
LYSEEADLCLRLRRAGWEVGWQREATVHHAGFGSQAAAGEYQRARTMLEGMAVFYQKHYSREAVRSMMRFQLAAIPFVSLFTRPGLAPRHPLYRERLQARRDVAREWLARAGAGAFPIDGWTPRILARQLRLAWAWLRQGRFPLDDY